MKYKIESQLLDEDTDAVVSWDTTLYNDLLTAQTEFDKLHSDMKHIISPMQITLTDNESLLVLKKVVNTLHKNDTIRIIENTDMTQLLIEINTLENNGSAEILGGVSSYIKEVEILNNYNDTLLKEILPVHTFFATMKFHNLS